MFLNTHKQHVVLCLLDDGRLHKAINVNNKMHIIEEMELFRNSQPVQHIELDSDKVRWSAVRENKSDLLSDGANQ